jgi:hypothetical protein
MHTRTKFAALLVALVVLAITLGSGDSGSIANETEATVDLTEE